MVSALASVVAHALPLLSAISEDAASKKPAPNKWSKKEILGHLIDSAANNHQRFMRLQLQTEISLPGYDQDDWVRLNRYQQRTWNEIVTLWSAYNRHLASVIESLDDSALGHVWHSPDGDVTLEFIANDYVRHLEHHLTQIGIHA
ncbi:MAG TPA: DinB family protein [Vicinamibacterales bacterium]|nr:DinB family protein [Vicinamibacterales bacterium]